MNMDHSFTPTAHGKGPADAIGFMVKHRLRVLTRLRKAPFTTAQECVQALQAHYEQADLAATEASGAEHGVHRRVFEFVPSEVVAKIKCKIKTIRDTKKNHFYVGNPNLFDVLIMCYQGWVRASLGRDEQLVHACSASKGYGISVNGAHFQAQLQSR